MKVISYDRILTPIFKEAIFSLGSHKMEGIFTNKWLWTGYPKFQDFSRTRKNYEPHGQEALLGMVSQPEIPAFRKRDKTIATNPKPA